MSHPKQLTKQYQLTLAWIQLVVSIAYGAATYYQAQLIDSLESNTVSIYTFSYAFGFLLLYLGVDIFENYFREKKFYKLSLQTKVDVAKAFLSKGASAYKEKSEDQFISLFLNQVSTVLFDNIYLRFYIQKQIMLLGMSLMLLLVLFLECGIGVILSAILFGFIVRMLSQKLVEYQKEIQDKKVAFVETLSEIFNGTCEIHVNQMEKLAENDFNCANSGVEDAMHTYRLQSMRIGTLGVAENMFIYILTLIIGGALAVQGLVGISIFVIVAELMVQVLNGWSTTMSLYARVRGSEALRKSVIEYIDSPPDENCAISIEGQDTILEIIDVGFGFDPDYKVFETLSLSIYKGKKYLITGESGSGKSTLLELMCGHILPDVGAIKYGTKKIAYVPQDPFLFPGTLKENLVFNRDVATEQINKILEMVNLDLPLDLPIEANGNNLSGGQKARVALCRALLTEPELLLADEVTANLNAELGYEIESILLKNYTGMALCLVSHKAYCPGDYDFEVNVNTNRAVVRELK